MPNHYTGTSAPGVAPFLLVRKCNVLLIYFYLNVLLAFHVWEVCSFFPLCYSEKAS